MRRVSTGVTNRNFIPLPLILWAGLMGISFLLLPAGSCWAVSSQITRHSTGSDFLEGESSDVVIGSQGTIQLGLQAEVAVKEFDDVWSINTIVASGGAIYIGTSPNGGIYKYSLGELTEIYPAEPGDDQFQELLDHIDDSNDPNVEIVDDQEYLSNEHIFAMGTDLSGRLLAGISGEKCKLLRLKKDQWEVISEPNDAKYIFAIAVGTGGEIYLGTGPQGTIYKLDPFEKEAEVFYKSTDKNILSLAIGKDGFVYAGSDTRGLVYRIDPATQKATVLYDSDQEEVTALMFSSESDADEPILYAAATSAKIVSAQTQFASQMPKSGRPEESSNGKTSTDKSDGGFQLKIANTSKGTSPGAPQMKKPSFERGKPSKASHIYRITDEGFVTSVFDESAVFFSLAMENEKLLVGTGNNGQLFAVEPASEEVQAVYEDKESSQITSATTVGKDVYVGTANPAKLVKLGSDFSAEGIYTSQLIDAGQPAKWGKLQLEAEIPNGCLVLMSCRSGNVDDINDPTFSPWTEAIEVTQPTELTCPAGRFCQYRLELKSDDGKKSPLVREVAVAHTVPNLAPKVVAISVARQEAPDKKGIFKISYKAFDDNEDTLTYEIYFRKIQRQSWIEIEDDVEKDTFDWDGRTVEDGRYEIRVTASDRKSNTTETTLSGSRVSDPVVVDNTGPAIEDYSVQHVNEDKVKIAFRAVDEFSAIGKAEYTVNSNADWVGTLPTDLVYDTTNESFVILIEDISAGENVIALKALDDAGNTTYKSFVVSK